MTKRIVQPQNSNKAFQRTDDNNKTRETRERMKSQNWTIIYNYIANSERTTERQRWEQICNAPSKIINVIVNMEVNIGR